MVDSINPPFDREYGEGAAIEETKIDSLFRAKKELRALEARVMMDIYKFEAATGVKVYYIYVRRKEVAGKSSEISEIILDARL